MKIIGMIPARAGSKGVPKKNIKDLKGRPLIAYTIEAAKKSMLDGLYCTSDSDEILNVAKRYGCQSIKRPDELANDTSSLLEVIKHFSKRLDELGVDYDAIMILYPVYPFRSTEIINEAINYFKSQGADKPILGLHEPYTHPYLIRTREQNGDFSQILEFDINKYYRRQTYPEMYEICHMISIVPKARICEINNQLYTEDAKSFVIKDIFSTVNIDTPRDMVYAEFLLEKGYIQK